MCSYPQFLLLLLALLFTFAIDSSASQSIDNEQSEANDTRLTTTFEIRIGNHMASLELAVTGPEQEQGFMFHKSLYPHQGMLFIYSRGSRRSFWMRNTSISLDLGFFSEDGILREIHPLYPFEESPVFSRRKDIKFAVEMRQGWFAAHGVRSGSSLDLHAVRKALKARGFDPHDFSLANSR